MAQQVTATKNETSTYVSNIARLKGQQTSAEGALLDQDSTDELSIILFEIGSSTFALPTIAVTEVMRGGSIVPIPRAPAFIEGIIEIREQVIPVVDLRKKLGFSTSQVENTVIIVAIIGGLKTGLVVDAAHKVISLSAEELQNLGSIVSGAEARYIYRTINRDGQPIVILNTNAILSEDEISSLADVRDS